MTRSTAGSLITAEEEKLVAAVRGIAGDGGEVEPAPGDHAAEDALARAALERLAGAGLLNHVVPTEHRTTRAGQLSVRTICILREELAHASGLDDLMFVMQGLGSAVIAIAGNAATRARWLPAVARGEAIAAIAITEPEAGSDSGAITTLAQRDGAHYRLTGEKTWISNAGLADFYTVLARTGEAGHRGLTAFLVEADTPGLSVAQRLTIMAPHPIGTLGFEGCRVPASHRLGEEGSGFECAMRVLERYRPTVGAAANGFARRALDESRARARLRSQFGRPIAEFQGIRFRLADMATRLEAARLLVLRAADVIDAGRAGADSGRAAAMAKLFATEAAQLTVDDAVQIHGALGVMRGHVIERLYREVRALRIYEGTSEIQRSIIARSLLSGAP